MTAPASALVRFRTDPTQPRAWVKAFRRAVPRRTRQPIIDAFDVNAALDALEQTPPTDGGALHAYVTVLYYATCARLARPDTVRDVAGRERQRTRLGRLVGLSAVEVGADLTKMRAYIEADHERWRRRQQRYEARIARRLALTRPADTAATTEGGR